MRLERGLWLLVETQIACLRLAGSPRHLFGIVFRKYEMVELTCHFQEHV